MMVGLIFYYILMSVVAYLIGSIPTGYIVVKLIKNEDIRNIGSGSTGATNVKRVLGKKWFFAVMLLDAIKGFIPVHMAINFSTGTTDEIMLAPALAAFMVLLGHAKPIFLNFKGGKSVASGVGTLIALSPVVGLATAAIWGVVTYVTRYVSVGSITAVFIAPFLMMIRAEPIAYITYCGLMALWIISTHKENIQRLRKGEENKVR